MKSRLLLLCLLLFSQQALSLCGPRNLGALPNAPTRFCLGEKVPRYDYCGNPAGTLTGTADHPLFCETTWSNMNLSTVQVCAGNVVVQSATRGSTTRDRNVYSLNQGWIWTPATSTVNEGESFRQTSNCGAKRTATGTKVCVGSAYSPDPALTCSGTEVTVTNNCGSKTVQGTKNCGNSGAPIGGGLVTNMHEDTIWTTTVYGDEGYFQANGTSLNETILYNENRNTIIRRYQSAAGFPYRMWIDDNEPGGFGVNLKDRESFDNWLHYMEEIDPATGEEFHPNKHWCELIESAWTPWVNDTTPPTACGSHTYTRSRQCDTQQGAAKPCDSTCPNGLPSQTQTESVTIDNGSCSSPPPPPPPPPSVICTEAWTPAVNTQCAGVVFAQTRCDGVAANGNRRGSIGTNPSACAPPPPPSDSNPVCGSLSTQTFYISNFTSGLTATVNAFRSANPAEQCAVGVAIPLPYPDGTGNDRLIVWSCRSGSKDQFCSARILCDNAGTSSCTHDIN